MSVLHSHNNKFHGGQSSLKRWQSPGWSSNFPPFYEICKLIKYAECKTIDNIFLITMYGMFNVRKFSEPYIWKGYWRIMSATVPAILQAVRHVILKPFITLQECWTLAKIRFKCYCHSKSVMHPRYSHAWTSLRNNKRTSLSLKVPQKWS